MHPLARNYSTADIVYAMNTVGARAFSSGPSRHKTTDDEQQAEDALALVDTLSEERAFSSLTPSSLRASTSPLIPTWSKATNRSHTALPQ